MPYNDYNRQKENSRLRYANKRTEILAAMRQAYSEDPRGKLARNRLWRSQNSKQCVARAVAYERARYQTDPTYRLRKVLKSRVQKFVSGRSKAAPTMALVGANLREVRAHLEAQFKPGMTWENHGPVWHIDHILPCAAFDLADPTQQRKCFHFTNLQPLFVLDNLRKGDRVVDASPS